MNVEMENGLSRAGADVEDGAVSLLDVALASDVRGGKVAAPDYFRLRGLRLLQSGKMLLGNDQNMCWGLRIHVLEGEDVFIFVNLVGGNFAPKDATEEAIRIAHGWLTGER